MDDEVAETGELRENLWVRRVLVLHFAAVVRTFEHGQRKLAKPRHAEIQRFGLL